MAGAFCVELQKAHRRHDLLFCLLVPLIVMLWTGSLLSPGPDELQMRTAHCFTASRLPMC